MIEAFVEPISPLQFNREGLEILIEFAKLGLPDLFDRDSWEVWNKKENKIILERAIKKKEMILREHKVKPLDQSIANQIDEIVKEADRDILASFTLK